MALSEESLVAMRVAHLGMIQGVITRMSGFSASAKTFLVTILAGLAAISLQANSMQLGVIAMIAAVLLFLIDTYYMTLEVQFRTFYDKVIVRPLDDAADMGIAPSVCDGDTKKALTSKSNLMFYVPVLFACILFIVYGGIHEWKAGRLFGADHSRVEQSASANSKFDLAPRRVAEPVQPAAASTSSATGRDIRGVFGKAAASPEPVRK
ncbi:hypothetical protein OK349_06620 [Sphingomonas sp. BT-65]|uniref:hypothetical protein n=1 Tax=Sphingomonas sp. BT-65 TaxID=2989821 RepID=UPI0022360507|nr:hypothetical protein [Sphingomonas sp. BT-65]MCW4461375.1 hypothetical protein [Sphingomonas sp. BT-65]